MKTSQLAAVSAAVIAMCTLVSTRSLANNGNGNGSSVVSIPSVPVGALSAFPSVVQTGTKPTLTWSILYPSKVSDVAVIGPPGTITLTTNNIFVSVQPVGTGVTACSAGEAPSSTFAEARMSVNGGTYNQLFYGTNSQVQPAYSLYIKKHTTNDTLNFGGSYVRNDSWTSFYTTKSQNMQVVSLVNGDTPPTYFPLHQSSSLANYLRPYLDASGKVKIGPMSILVMMELGQTNRSLNCFDYQDVVLLVTLSTNHPNNGHGNNLDGVDSSNPGQGKGGPNGRVDPSGGFDDERK